ncbi:MAG TPA: hypothetical protein ENI60_09220 [Candidatus Fraserbacteria bacterium]|nr:hypothetical protein [Candidatus Fraserbacteria bacterium]
MNWKDYYARELASEPGQAFIREKLSRYPQGDPQLAAILSCGGIVSFPHTSIYYSGELIARLVGTIYHLGIPRVIALGVLHQGVLPEPFRSRYQEFTALGSSEGRRETPFGPILLAQVPQPAGKLIQENEAMLAAEFSLDIFFALLAAGARQRGTTPPSVLPLFISATRDPHGSFAPAAQLALRLKEHTGPGTAIVTTGDLVHYGTAYSTPQEMAAKPQGQAELEEFFLRRTQEALDLACRHDYQGFFQIASQELKDDQRQILPLIGEYLGSGMSYQFLQFGLSDYSAILEVEPPCLVASALVGFLPG